jgi:2-polyprenyl-3-methyl-5-hydroxy-6-metoxy-1,4-benzoquinol methylase
MSPKAALARDASPQISERVYSNLGNTPLVDLLESPCQRVLDIGCGAGDNAALIKLKNPKCEIFGITSSSAEAVLARAHMARCWVSDIECGLPGGLESYSFDTMVFSHVLEHLRDPASVLARFSRLLCSGGQVLIAVPNVLSWRMRLQFMSGNFQYQSSGVLDDTHLHFYTYVTAEAHLLPGSLDLDVAQKTVSGNVPLWLLRRYIISSGLRKRIDSWGCHHWPNLFGEQVLIRAVKR